MFKARFMLLVGILSLTSAHASEPVVGTDNQKALLESRDPDLAANKQLVYDFWREVFEGGHMENIDQYVHESYIQHNPNVPTGRDAFVAFFSQVRDPKPIAEEILAPLVSIVAERDMVILSFAREYEEPNDPGQTYTTTWFDMFRIEDGRIIEHWDPATKN